MTAVIYARYSSDSQREESIEGQIRECTAFAEKNGITVLRHYIDRAFSAKTDNRPEFQAMIKDSSKKLFDMIIVWKLDRFARNRYDSARYKAALKKNGVKVVSATEVISEGAEGIILESVLEGYAEYYSADLSEKVIRGMTDNALKCKFNGGTLPTGYTIDSEQHFQIDPLTAPYVLEAFKKYDAGYTMTAIRDWLNEKGVKNTRGQAFSYNSIQHLLNNRRYMGEFRYRDTVIPDGIPAIVPKDLFERVQEKLAKNKKAPARHKAEDDYLLTTKLFCGYCGSYMCGESGTSHTGKVHHYYKCATVKKKRGDCHKKPVNKAFIEDFIVHETMKEIRDDKVIAAIVSTVMDLQEQENTQLPLHEQQLKEAETGINNLLNAIQQGILTPSTKSRLEELEATKEDLEIKIANEKLAKPKLTAEFVTMWLERFRNLDMRKKEHRQQLIDTFVNSVYLFDDKLTLHINYKDGTKTVTFDEMKAALDEQAAGSDLDCRGAPNRNGDRDTIAVFSFICKSLRLQRCCCFQGGTCYNGYYKSCVGVNAMSIVYTRSWRCMQGRKLTICALLCAALIAGALPGYASAQGELSEETATAGELGLIPGDWESDLLAEADFSGCYQLITSLISLCDDTALPVWQENVDPSAFPVRTMRRDDGLILLMLAAEALGYNCYNAREYGFCTENLVDYDKMFSQLSQDYPYCDTGRDIPMYFDTVGGEEDPIGNVSSSAVFWMQRRMDVNHRLHFLDHDEALDFHLDQPLTREDAIAAAVRLYNSEMLEYDYTLMTREPNEEDEAILAAAEARKQAILSHTDEPVCEGTAYYVSRNGSDENDGLTPETAWATLDKVNAASLSRGDGVYFERGGTWRGQLWAQDGVIYSAYGEGPKPNIFASPENGAGPDKWSLLDGTDNIWVYHRDMMDCGILVFNDGESWGKKVAPAYLDGYRSTVNEGQPFDVRTELTEDLMFFSQADSILYDGAPFRYTVMDNCDRGEYPEEVVGPLYLRCDEGDPGEVFDSIEFAVRQNIVLPADDAVFCDLCLKYTGAHCIYGGDMGYDVSFCEIGWVGGSPQYYRYDDGQPVLLGNGVECDGSYDHYSVTDCYIYQCYDAGVSNQDPSESPEVTGEANFESHDVIQRNITYARNVFAYDSMPVEIFFALEDDAGYGRHRMENVLIEENYFLYTGYGWYMEEKAPGAAYQGYDDPNAAENFRIVDNVFYLSTGALLQTGAPEKWLPELDGNTYVQNEGGVLIVWPSEGYQRQYPYYYNANRDTVTDVIRDVLGDRNGTALKN